MVVAPPVVPVFRPVVVPVLPEHWCPSPYPRRIWESGPSASLGRLEATPRKLIPVWVPTLPCLYPVIPWVGRLR